MVSIAPVFGQQAPSQAFTNPLTISNNNSDSITPQALVSKEGIFVTWVGTDLARSDIFFSKSSDNGSTFSNPSDLSGSTSGQSGYPSFVQQDKNVDIVWQSSHSGNSTIFFAESTDGGASFGTPIRISDISRTSAFPKISSSENHVYVAWIEKSENGSTNIVFAKSTDGGKSFAFPFHVTQNSGNSGIPKIFSVGNEVYLTWEDNSKGNFEIFLSKSNDYGSSFSSPVDISNNIGQSGTPQVIVANKNLYAVWMDDSVGNYEILFAKSIDGGLSFEKPVNISNTLRDSGYPQFTVSENNIYVTWTETISGKNYDVLVAKSNDSGKTFGTPINLSKNLGQSGWPQVGIDGKIYISWLDNSTGDFDILLTKSSDGGMTYENPLDMSNTKNESYDNTMAVTGNNVFMIWQENQQGKHAIMFSKSLTVIPEFGSLATIALVISIIAILGLSFRSVMRITK